VVPLTLMMSPALKPFQMPLGPVIVSPVPLLGVKVMEAVTSSGGLGVLLP